MWTYGYAITLLDGSGNGYGAGPAPYALPFEKTILALVINKLTVMGGDVYEERIEILQLIDGTEQTLCAVAFQRRQHLKREMPSFIVV